MKKTTTNEKILILADQIYFEVKGTPYQLTKKEALKYVRKNFADLSLNFKGILKK